MSAWVCRCSSGFCSASRPAIHIFAGEKVCIHAITPTQSGALLASRIWRWIASASISTGFQTTSTGQAGGGAEPAGDLLRLVRDLVQGLRPYRRLAAGQEPDLGVVAGASSSSLLSQRWP